MPTHTHSTHINNETNRKNGEKSNSLANLMPTNKKKKQSHTVESGISTTIRSIDELLKFNNRNETAEQQRRENLFHQMYFSSFDCYLIHLIHPFDMCAIPTDNGNLCLRTIRHNIVPSIPPKLNLM